MRVVAVEIDESIAMFGFYRVFKFFLSLVEGFLKEEAKENEKSTKIVLGPRSSKVFGIGVDRERKFKIIKFPRSVFVARRS
jgi:hypothetical protein